MSNRLQYEKSPYLRLHAQDPVDWYPWGGEALEKAKRENKPVFLSVGYSTCHWCHVMAAESFADAEVAEALNRAFVAVKVDREERPDVDAVYMRACRALTGSGGWPMTLLLTPEGEPFFAATYLPKNSSGRRMGLLPREKPRGSPVTARCSPVPLQRLRRSPTLGIGVRKGRISNSRSRVPWAGWDGPAPAAAAR